MLQEKKRKAKAQVQYKITIQKFNLLKDKEDKQILKEVEKQYLQLEIEREKEQLSIKKKL